MPGIRESKFYSQSTVILTMHYTTVFYFGALPYGGSIFLVSYTVFSAKRSVI